MNNANPNKEKIYNSKCARSYIMKLILNYKMNWCQSTLLIAIGTSKTSPH